MSSSPELRVEMPNGQTLRTRSTRRYVVAVFDRERWSVMYRTDTESKALARWRQECRQDLAIANVVDTTTGTVIR